MATAQVLLPQDSLSPVERARSWDDITYNDEFSTEGRRDIMALFIAVVVLATKSEKLNTEWAKQLRDRNFDERMSSAGRMRINAWCTLAFGILSAAATISGAYVAYRGSLPPVVPGGKSSLTPFAKSFQTTAEAVAAASKTGSQFTDQIIGHLKGQDDAQVAYTEALLQAAREASQSARELREKAIKDGRDYQEMEAAMGRNTQR